MPGRTVPIPSVGAAANLRSAAQSIRAAAGAGDFESLKQALTDAAGAFESAQYAIDMLESRLRDLGKPNTSNVTRQAPVLVSGDRIAGGITVHGVLPAVTGQGLDLTLSGQVGTIAAVDHSTGLYLELDLKGSTIAVSATGVYTVTGSTVVLKPTADSTAAIQLQNAAGTAIITVDTTNARVALANGVRPEYKAIATAGTQPCRIGCFNGDGSAYWGLNLSFDGTNWNLDDTGQSGTLIRLLAGAVEGFTTAAGANPRTLTQTFNLTAAGNLRLFSVPVYADNATALAAGLTAGMHYRITATDHLAIVH